MRRISLAVALLSAVAAGCTGGAKAPGAGGARGTPGSSFTVVINPVGVGVGSTALGGRIASSTTGLTPNISCGSAGGISGTTCAQDFAWDTASVQLTATIDAAGEYVAVMWAGACNGQGTTCTLIGNSEKKVYVKFFRAGEQLSHPNFSDGPTHRDAYNNRLASGLDCFRCHGAGLQGMGNAIGCSGCHVTPAIPQPVKASIVFSPAAPLTATTSQVTILSALATDPNNAAVNCTWSVTPPPGSTSTTVLVRNSAVCSGTPGTASFTPDVAGTYVVRVTASNQAGTAEATILVPQQFGGGTAAVGTDVADAELTEIANRLHAVLAGGWNSTPPANVAKSFAGLDNANPNTTYAIVDVRLPADFARGHIPGAVNAPLAELPDVLLANPNFPEAATPTKKVIVAGYNAGDSTMGAVLFNSARWTGTSATTPATAVSKPATALQYGMSGWTFDLSASPTRFDDDVVAGRRYQSQPTEAGAVPVLPPGSTELHNYTSIGAFSGSPTTNQKILIRARAFLKSLVDEAVQDGTPLREAMWTTFVKLKALRDDADSSNDPQMLDVRSAAAYAGGHVPGAFFIAYQQVARLVPTNVALTGVAGGAAIPDVAATPAQPTTRLIDPSRKVFVQCVTGHTGGHATIVLGILGYRARNVLYGINGWTNSTVAGSGQMQNFDNSATGNDFPLTPSTACNPGNITASDCVATFTPSRTGCKQCHANYLAHFADITITPIPGIVPEVASEGEG